MPATWIEPASGRSKPGDHAQRRGLAGAVRAEQRVKLAFPHGEVETVDGGALEALGEAADVERQRRLGRKGREHPAKLAESGFGPVNRPPAILPARQRAC